MTMIDTAVYSSMMRTLLREYFTTLSQQLQAQDEEGGGLGGLGNAAGGNAAGGNAGGFGGVFEGRDRRRRAEVESPG